MGSVGVRPSAAVSAMLRRKRNEMGLTLREVSSRMEKQGESLPPSTLARIETGKLDPGVRRLHLLLRLYDVAPHLVADLVELESLAIEKPPQGDLETLYRNGIDHWKKGNIPQGIAHLLAVREHIADDPDSKLLRQKASLSFAITARNLGKFRLAKQIVEDLLCEPPDPSLTVRVFVVAASTWRGLGAVDAAVAFVQYAAERLRMSDPRERAWVQHQAAKILLDAGRPEDARRALELALDHYRDLRDTYGETGASLLRVRLLENAGHIDAAIEAVQQVVDLAREHGHERLVMAARLRHGELIVASGEPETGLEVLRECLGLSILHGDRNSEFHAHYHLWKAYEAIGDRDRAGLELRTAKHRVQHIDEITPEASEVLGLSSERGAP